MARSKMKESHPEQSTASKEPRKYRFEVGLGRMLLFSLSLILAMAWMFTLGVLVGRGTPLVSNLDLSWKGEFLRFVGLGKEMPEIPENVAETWDDPQKMLESLSYYEDLTQQGGGAPTIEPAPSPPASPAPAKPQTPVTPVPAPPVTAPPPVAAASPAPPLPQEKAKIPESDTTSANSEPPGNLSEHYTLLIASLKDVENANRMLDQLKTKGYAPRIEAIDLHGGGRWNRVLVGSFQSREEAMKFAADFNRKERMEGLVIRESN
jgi:cell division septation protein DedD